MPGKKAPNSSPSGTFAESHDAAASPRGEHTAVKPPLHEADFREFVVRHAAGLPPQQRVIADHLLDNLQTVPFLSVPELAQKVGVSEATIVRFAQRIGYAGFTELKMALVDLLQQRLGAGDVEPPLEAVSDVLESVAALESSNIRRTVEALDRAVFAEVADAVFRAAHTYTFGMGISAHLAEVASYFLTQIGIRTTPLSTRFSSPLEQLVMLRPSDLLLVLSFPPYSRQTLEMIEEEDRLGAVTVAVTDRPTAPAATRARFALPVRSDNTMFTNAVAAVTVVFNALATEIANRHRGPAIEAFSRINRVLAEDDDVLTNGR